MRTKKVHGTRSSRNNRNPQGSSYATSGFNPMYDNAHKRLFFRRATNLKPSTSEAKIDHKNIALLTKYISERGRILPQRTNNVSAGMQRQLRTAIKRARILALLPFVAD